MYSDRRLTEVRDGFFQCEVMKGDCKASGNSNMERRNFRQPELENASSK